MSILYSDLLQLASKELYMDYDGMMQLQENFPFSDGRELFYTALKYSFPENTCMTWTVNKNFKANSFVICKALSKFTKDCLTNIGAIWYHDQHITITLWPDSF